MARLTFRADDEMMSQLEEMDASQSEVIRRALRNYLAAENISTASQKRSNLESRMTESLPQPKQIININIQFTKELIKNRTVSVERGTGFSSTRVSICDCGNSMEEKWQFCPQCGRQTSTEEV